jgi:hypothetical protein
MQTQTVKRQSKSQSKESKNKHKRGHINKIMADLSE